MSIFYNMKMNPNGKEDYNRLVEFSDFLQSPVIDDQSKYSVGVKRFKIPITNIDLYRIYENTLLIGLIPHSRNFGGYASNQRGEATYPADCFDPTGWNVNDVDVNITTKAHSNSELNGRYIPIHSQIEFAQVLTRTLAKRTNPAQRNNRIGALISNGAVATVSVPSNGIWTTLSSIAGRVPPLGQTQTSRLTCGLRTWRPKETGASATNNNMILHSVADLQFRVVFNLGVANEIVVYLGEGMFPSIKSYTDWKAMNFSGTGDNSYSFGFATDAIISYDRAKFNEGGFRKVVYPTSQIAHEFCINSYDDLDLLWRNNSGKTIAFQVRDNACLGIGSGLVGVATDWETTMNGYLQITEVNFSGEDGEGLESGADFLEYFPRFVWNDETNKIEFNATDNFHSQFAVYANSGVLNAVDFPSSMRINSNYNINGKKMDGDKIYKSIYFEYSYNENNELGNELCGALLSFRNSTNSFTEKNVNNPTQLTTIYTYAETSSSVWKRKFLYGLEFTTNRLAVLGEVSAGGNARRKILTDFEIDPSTTNRDYLIYSPSGNSIRYYPLRTNQPLESVDCQIHYVDMLGFSHPLRINNNQSASIKLEFIPNNQINNY